jgi:hypothetical protein
MFPRPAPLSTAQPSNIGNRRFASTTVTRHQRRGAVCDDFNPVSTAASMSLLTLGGLFTARRRRV